MLNFSSHMHTMADTVVPEVYPLSNEPPVITSLECKVAKIADFVTLYQILNVEHVVDWVGSPNLGHQQGHKQGQICMTYSGGAMGENRIQRSGWSSSL